MRERIDLDAYLHAKVAVLNDAGGRGYSDGVRTFDCPLCGDDRERGWMNVERWTAGCFRAGCPAEPRLQGGAVQWVMVAERLKHRAAVWALLLERFRRLSPAQGPRGRPEVADWCRLPVERRPLWLAESLLGNFARRFVLRQWGLGVPDAQAWQLSFCVRGRYERRIIIPIEEGGRVVAFQARSYVGREPRYLNSVAGPQSDPRAECGRPAGAVLFNLDGVREGDEVMLVEGAGDVMAWHLDDFGRRPHAVGLLGMVLTPEKAALLRARRPGRVVVALDAEPEALVRALAYVEDLGALGLEARLGQWVGGKDAGSASGLRVRPALTIEERVKLIFGEGG